MAQNDAGLISGKIRELTRLIRETRLADTATLEQFRAADQFPAQETIAVQSAQKVRALTKLEALSRALKGVYSEIPVSARTSQNAFTFALLPGTPPRFWVDLSSFVVMVNDGSTYQFLKDARDERVVLHESDTLEGIANAITDYVAKCIVEQDFQPSQPSKANTYADADEPVQDENGTSDPVEPTGDHLADEAVSQSHLLPQKEPVLPQHETLPAPIIIQPAPAQTDWVKLFLAFSLGVFVGAVTLFLLAWFQTPSAS